MILFSFNSFYYSADFLNLLLLTVTDNPGNEVFSADIILFSLSLLSFHYEIIITTHYILSFIDNFIKINIELFFQANYYQKLVYFF